MVSWTYLRFYKPAFPDLDTAQSPALRGDASDSFAFTNLFPEVMRPAISGISDSVFNLLVAVRVCTPFSAEAQQHAGGRDMYQSRAQGSSRAETERRRALALKALDQRLNDAAKRAPVVVPQPKEMVKGGVMSQPRGEGVMEVGGGGGMLGETRYEPEEERTGN